jgi:hypothetical protein
MMFYHWSIKDRFENIIRVFGSELPDPPRHDRVSGRTPDHGKAVKPTA